MSTWRTTDYGYTTATVFNRKLSHSYKKGTMISKKIPRDRHYIKICKRDTRPPHNHNKISLADVSIPGVRKLFDDNIGICQKIFWLLAVIFCTAVCISQLTDRITTFLDYPVVIDVSVSRNQTVRFPSMTLCPTHFFTQLSLLVEELKITACQNPESILNTTFCRDESIKYWMPTFQELNTTFQDLWNNLAFPASAILATIPSSQNYDHFASNWTLFPLHFKHIPTVWGPCLVLIPVEDLEYRGPFTFLDLDINHTALNHRSLTKQLSSRSQFFLHSESADNKHDAFYLVQSLYHGYETNIRLTVKDFVAMNRSVNPCLEEIDATICRNECLDRKLQRRLTCSLPFIQSESLPPCDTLTSALQSLLAAQHFYNKLKASDCTCARKCSDKVYSAEVDIFSKLETITRLRLFYGDNVHETVKEVFTYSFPALISDISGNLGFFLGVSLLSIFEVLEGLVQKGRFTCQNYRDKKVYK